MTARLVGLAAPGLTSFLNSEIIHHTYISKRPIPLIKEQTGTWFCFRIVQLSSQNFLFVVIYLYLCIWNRHKVTRRTVTNSVNHIGTRLFWLVQHWEEGVFHPYLTPLSLKLDYSNFVQNYFGKR